MHVKEIDELFGDILDEKMQLIESIVEGAKVK